MAVSVMHLAIRSVIHRQGFEPRHVVPNHPTASHETERLLYLSRRVPKAYQTYERGEIVLISSGVRIADDPQAVAAKEAIIGKLDAELLTHWRRLAAGQSSDPREKFEAAVGTARDLGLTYASALEVRGIAHPVAGRSYRAEPFACRGDVRRHQQGRAAHYLPDYGNAHQAGRSLKRETIVLDHSVPHIKVRPDGRELKTERSVPDIPPVGAALMAMRLQPDGFPRYREKSDQPSAAVNKTLAARKLRHIRPVSPPTGRAPGQTLGILSKASERIQCICLKTTMQAFRQPCSRLTEAPDYYQSQPPQIIDADLTAS